MHTFFVKLRVKTVTPFLRDQTIKVRATVKAVVYAQFKQEDGTYHLKIKVFHNDIRRFIETSHYVSEKQLDKKLKIKDKFVLRQLQDTLYDYRKSIGELGPRLEYFTCDDLKAILPIKRRKLISSNCVMSA